MPEGNGLMTCGIFAKKSGNKSRESDIDPKTMSVLFSEELHQ